MEKNMDQYNKGNKETETNFKFISFVCINVQIKLIINETNIEIRAVDDCFFLMKAHTIKCVVRKISKEGKSIFPRIPHL